MKVKKKKSSITEDKRDVRAMGGRQSSSWVSSIDGQIAAVID